MRYRHDERELIIAVNNLEKRIIDDAVSFLHSLSRDLTENMSEKAIFQIENSK